MPEPSFRRIQYAFAAHIRDPAASAAPADVDPERMRIYRELFFNNVKSFVEDSFPVLGQLLDETHWQELVQDFFARHRSATPFSADFPQEFLRFLRDERAGHPEDPPFLLELAHYEWVELAVSLAEGHAPAASRELREDPLACTIALSNVAWPLRYCFPVHRVSRDYQPLEPPAEPTCLTVYRTRDDEVRFLELNLAAFRLLQVLEEDGPSPAKACLLRIGAELRVADPTIVLAHGADTLRALSERGVIGSA